MGLSISARLAATRRKLSGASLVGDGRLAALLLFCALFLPFILRHHRYPMPAFYQEWLAIFFALAASILVAAKFRSERFELPLAALIPLALLPSVLTHLAVGDKLIAHGPLLYLISIGSAALLMTIGRKLGSIREAVSLADVMAAAFVTGALASCVASWHWRYQTGVFGSVSWGLEGGWIAQRNQNALHLWLGVLGISHLVLSRKVSWFHFVFGLGILVEAAMQTQSRSVYLYAACGLMLGIWAAAKSAAPDARRSLLLIGISPVMFLVAIQGMRLIPDRQSGGDSRLSTGAIQRYAPATVAQDPRLGLWLAAAQITQARPWIGTGPGSYVRESWVLADRLPSTAPTTVPATHAHNLFLQIGAELGAPTALALAGLMGAWLMFALRQTDWQRKWLHVAMPLAILTHNQVEFSLWYLYFLVPTALAMGAATNRSVGKGVPAAAVMIVAVLGLGLAARLDHDYQVLEQAVAQSRSGRANAGQLMAAADHPIFGAWASTEIARQPASAGIVPQQQDWHARRALFAIPLAKAAVVRHAEILERSGKSAEAATERRVARRVFGN
ncbi:MAG: Wzy polymerase domain-containing protein [Sulfuritalea sp.]|nr:Wzy polymerase domain-containing protein [Sulfuritalea sp.]